jgi:hypothetical protein
MPQTIVLAAGTAGGTSSDIVVPAGAEVVIGAFASVGSISESPNYVARIMQVTPGQPNQVGQIDFATPSLLVSGPGTFRVIAGSSRISIGIFTD